MNFKIITIEEATLVHTAFELMYKHGMSKLGVGQRLFIMYFQEYFDYDHLELYLAIDELKLDPKFKELSFKEQYKKLILKPGEKNLLTVETVAENIKFFEKHNATDDEITEMLYTSIKHGYCDEETMNEIYELIGEEKSSLIKELLTANNNSGENK